MTDPNHEPPNTLRRDLSVAGVVLAAMFVVCGLATVGLGLLATSALSNWAWTK
jgi:hypothetical protein